MSVPDYIVLMDPYERRNGPRNAEITRDDSNDLKMIIIIIIITKLSETMSNFQ